MKKNNILLVLFLSCAFIFAQDNNEPILLKEASKALDKLTESRDRLDILKDYYDKSSMFNKQQQLND